MILEDCKMKHFVASLLLLLFAAASNAQSKTDEDAVRKLPQVFCDAWNAVLGIPPELQEVKTPIAIPGSNQK